MNQPLWLAFHASMWKWQTLSLFHREPYSIPHALQSTTASSVKYLAYVPQSEWAELSDLVACRYVVKDSEDSILTLDMTVVLQLIVVTEITNLIFILITKVTYLSR